MKQIQASAKIVNQDQSPSKSLACRLQVFRLSSRRWVSIGRAVATDASGDLRISVSFNQADNLSAPNLRLIKAQENAVLSDGGRLSYNSQSGLLSVDFGEIVNLPRVVTPVAASARLSRTSLRVGGAPQAVVMANTTPAAVAAPQLRVLNERIATRDAKIRSLENQIAGSQREKQQLTVQLRRLPELEQQLRSERETAAGLRRDLAVIPDLRQQLEAVRAENTRLKQPSEKKVAVSMMATNLGDQIGQAQREIREQGGNLALANVRIRMKGLMGDGGTNVTLLDADDLKRPEIAGALGDLEFDFSEDGGGAAAPSDVEVPDVRRLTETAARQILHSIGLRLEAVAGPSGMGGAAAGQAALQDPSAGQRAARGSSVTVIFAS